MSERAEQGKQQTIPEGEFDLLELLDRLEMLLEDMEELGIASRIDVEDLMNRIHARLDEMDDRDA